MDQSVIPECFVDTNLIETLVPPTRQYNHQKGCGTVTKVMRERFTDRFAVGIIDRDKVEVDYLQEFNVICTRGSLILHKHKTRHHYIIQVDPAMEQFIMDNAASVDISLSDYDLPNDLNSLKKVSKKVNSKNDQRFKRLFRDLLTHNASNIVLLANWVSYLKENTYHIDIGMLESLG